MTERASWAVLRQVVIATAEHDDDLAVVRQAFGLGSGFADPGLAERFMDDAILPVSTQTYLEFIAPTNDKAAVFKWLTKIGGRGGYVLSIQHPDVPGVRARALAAGVRIPIDVEVFGYQVIQLHPQEVGVLLEVDGIADPAVWFWDEFNPGPEPGAGIDEIIGVEVPVADPTAMATLWRDLLDLADSGSSDELLLGGGWVRFVPGGPSADWNIVLRRADNDAGKAATAPSLPGVRFELV
jgi:hypothetical protein